MRRIVPAAFVVLGLISCGGSGGGGGTTSTPTTPSTPTPPAPTNHAPTITSVTASPTFGIDSLTVYTFTAQASDPDGDAVTYQWQFGNWSPTGATVRTTFVGGWNGTVGVTATDTHGASATGTTNTFTIGSMTGKWRMRATLYTNWIWDFTLTQTTGTITGSFIDNVYGPGEIDPAEPGSISANGAVVMRTKQGHYGDIYLRGTMDTTGRHISGEMSGSALTISHQPFTMDKIGS